MSRLCLVWVAFATLFSPALRGTGPLATSPALLFHSSLTEELFAVLHAESLHAASSRHGPFLVPAPGIQARAPVLHFRDLRCTPADWEQILAALAGWQGGFSDPEASDSALRLILPDGRAFFFTAPPLLKDGSLAGAVRIASPGADSPLALRLHHDGAKSIVAEIRPAPLGSDAPSPPAPFPVQP